MLTDYWQEYPPIHVMLKGFLGAGGKPKTTTGPAVETVELQQLVSGLPTMEAYHGPRCRIG
jgi:hypothetical protein